MKTAENSEKQQKGKPRGKAFAKGQSGNPGGRPPKTEEERTLEQACRAKSMNALAVIEEIMVNGENERNRFAAAMAIIERGHGKPEQPIKADVDTKVTVEIVRYG